MELIENCSFRLRSIRLVSNAGPTPSDAADFGEPAYSAFFVMFRSKVAASILCEVWEEEVRLVVATIGQSYIVL